MPEYAKSADYDQADDEMFEEWHPRTNPLSTAACLRCRQSYLLNGDDMYAPPGLRLNGPNVRPKAELTTWADWLQHISTFCPACRYSEPPRACQDDLRRIERESAEPEPVRRGRRRKKMDLIEELFR